ncbi:MAG: hypothetical protein K9M56_01805 [Victivallales bacterium]|nr:hypothetical protein [Victivallales bacterium]
MARKIRFIAAIIILILVIYNFATSEYCIKNFVIPYIAEANNSKINVREINISVINSSAEIEGLNYQTKNFRLSTETVDIKTSLWDLIFNRKISVKKLNLKNSNIIADISPSDVKSSKSRIKAPGKGKAAAAAGENKSYSVSLKNIDIKNLNLKIKNGETVTKINDLNLTIPDIRPGKESKIDLDSNILIQSGKKSFKGFLKSKTTLTVDKKLVPVDIVSKSILEFGVNKIPLTIRLDTDKHRAFVLNISLENIDVEPVASALIPGKYGGTIGGIKKIYVRLKGKNIDNILNNYNRIQSVFTVKGLDLNNKGLFSVKSEMLNSECDLSAVMKGNIIPKKIKIKNLNAEYQNKKKKFAINNFNLKLNKKGKGKAKAVLNTKFKYKKGYSKISGSAAGDINLVCNDITMPRKISSNITFHVDGKFMPLKVLYKNDFYSENIFLVLRKFELKSFRILLPENISNMNARFEKVTVNIKGKGKNALTSYRKNSGKALDTTVSFKDIEFGKKGKYSGSVSKMNIAMNLDDIINKKYYLNKLKIVKPEAVIIQEKTNRNKRKPNVIQKPGREKVKTAKKAKRFDIDIKNISVTEGKLKVNGRKKLVLSDFIFTSKQIKTDKLSRFKVLFDYTLNQRLKGNINANNYILLKPALLPEKLNSDLTVKTGQKLSKSTISFNCRKTDKENISYKTKAEINKLALGPFMRVFAAPPYDKTKVFLDKLQVKLNGTDIADYKKSNGNIQGKLSKITLPVELKGDDAVQTLFLPLRFIAELANRTRLKFVSKKVANAMIKIDNAFNHKKRINFKKGNINISFDNGLMKINEFEFFGDNVNPVSEIKSEGSLNFNSQAVSLNTETIFAGLKIPLSIKGTIKKPKTDNAELMQLFVQKNVETITKTGMDINDTVNETINNIKEQKYDVLLKNIPKIDSSESYSTQKTESKSKIDNSVSKLSGILNQLKNSGKTQKKSNVRRDDKLIKTLGNMINSSKKEKSEKKSSQNMLKELEKIEKSSKKTGKGRVSADELMKELETAVNKKSSSGKSADKTDNLVKHISDVLKKAESSNKKSVENEDSKNKKPEKELLNLLNNKADKRNIDMDKETLEKSGKGNISNELEGLLN